MEEFEGSAFSFSSSSDAGLHQFDLILSDNSNFWAIHRLFLLACVRLGFCFLFSRLAFGSFGRFGACFDPATTKRKDRSATKKCPQLSCQQNPAQHFTPFVVETALTRWLRSEPWPSPSGRSRGLSDSACTANWEVKETCDSIENNKRLANHSQGAHSLPHHSGLSSEFLVASRTLNEKRDGYR